MTDEMPAWRPAPGTLCARCHENPVELPGGIICPDCRAAIEAANRTPAEVARSTRDAQIEADSELDWDRWAAEDG